MEEITSNAGNGKKPFNAIAASKFVIGYRGITIFAKRALTRLLELAAINPKYVEIYYAAMQGREWMYHLQKAPKNKLNRFYGYCEPGDYWRSVIEAVEMAERARVDDPDAFAEDLAYFTRPIPDTKTKWASPTTQAIYMETI